ncbi:MAG: hypothetical protein ABIP77_10610 [Candidatus Limnocylindrales bacterium]
MAELTQLESKLGEVMGLAQAAQEATAKVTKLVDDDEIQKTLDRMRQEAEETEQRCEEVAGSFEGKKTAIQEQAKETKSEAKEMMQTYLGDEVEALDGFEFLTMAEAAELGHWEIVKKMADTIGEKQVTYLADWAVGVQRKHCEIVRESSLELAATEASG